MTFPKRLPIGGWNRCVHDAAIFDNENEFIVAKALDVSGSVEWWLRNDPPVFTIDTPAGGFRPDFLYSRELESKAQRNGILEVKGDFLYEAPDQTASLKARAACEWIRAVNSFEPEVTWEFVFLGEQEASEAVHLDGMIGNAVMFESPEHSAGAAMAP